MPSEDANDIRSYASQFLNEKVPYRFFRDTDFGYVAFRIINNEKRTDALLATLFWQLAKVTEPLKDLFQFESQVLFHGKDQYSLMVFVPTEREQPVVASLNELITFPQLASTFSWWRNEKESLTMRYTSQPGDVPDEGQSFAYARSREILSRMDVNFLKQVLNDFNMQIIFLPMPATEYNACFYNSPHHKIFVEGSDRCIATAGVYTDSVDGFGVTIPYHAVRDQVKQGIKQLKVNGVNATITRVDEASDSCFAVFANRIPEKASTSARGPLLGQTPRGGEMAEFDGASSGLTATTVHSWSPDILDYVRGSQAKIFTAPCTSPGDSGAALIDKDKNVLGFCFSRTAVGRNPGFSSWIWAECVFRGLDLL